MEVARLSCPCSAAAARHIHPNNWERLPGCGTVAGMTDNMLLDGRQTTRITFEITKKETAVDGHGLPVAVYEEVGGAFTLLFRDVSTTPLLVNWSFALSKDAIQATAWTMAGDLLGERVFEIGPMNPLWVEDLREEAVELAIERGVLRSQNQEMRMFVEGTAVELLDDNVIWCHGDSVKPPRRRISGKTNLGQLRFARWCEALRNGSGCLQTDPAKLA